MIGLFKREFSSFSRYCNWSWKRIQSKCSQWRSQSIKRQHFRQNSRQTLQQDPLEHARHSRQTGWRQEANIGCAQSVPRGPRPIFTAAESARTTSEKEGQPQAQARRRRATCLRMERLSKFTSRHSFFSFSLLMCELLVWLINCFLFEIKLLLIFVNNFCGLFFWHF